MFLRERRLKSNITQKEMAEICGYESSQYISNIERGLCSIPPRVLAVMATVYKIQPQKLAKQYNSIDLKLLEERMLRSS
ncbi:MAG: helix-turn-helix transcriptional regulator [Bdellovibrionaceae bacterium]|nr:helix-turn-helix transcriptional regulator [Pseudobdellovibrionaceae bacterium]